MSLRNGKSDPSYAASQLYGSSLTFHAARYFVYFTHLTYIGLCAYFCASSFHSGFFTLNLRRLRHGDTSQALWYPLQKWGRFLQAMHIYLYCTVVTFGGLAPPEMRRSPETRYSSSCHNSLLGNPLRCRFLCYSTGLFVSSPGLGTIRLIRSVAWNNISFHALNTVFVVIEVVSCRVPMPWGYFPLCVITLGLYLIFTYVIHATQHWYGKYGVTIQDCAELLNSLFDPQCTASSIPPKGRVASQDISLASPLEESSFSFLCGPCRSSEIGYSDGDEA